MTPNYYSAGRIGPLALRHLATTTSDPPVHGKVPCLRETDRAAALSALRNLMHWNTSISFPASRRVELAVILVARRTHPPLLLNHSPLIRTNRYSESCRAGTPRTRKGHRRFSASQTKTRKNPLAPPMPPFI